MKKLSISILLIMAGLCGIQAQELGAIKGNIIDAKSKENLEYVNIAVKEKESGELAGGGVSDQSGTFLIEELVAGNYIVEISFIGYKSLQREVKVTSSTINMGKIPLEEDSKMISEVQVTGQQSQMKFEIDKKVFNVGQDIAAKGASASEMLENIPSIEVDNEGSISLRGNSSVTIWINGKASGLTSDNRGDILEQMPAENIERVEVITNPGAKYSAEGTAGIINIILKDDIRSGYYGSVQAGVNTEKGYNASANINYNSGKFDFYTSLGYRRRVNSRGGISERSYSDDTYLNQTSEGEGFGGNLFARAGITYRPSKKDQFNLDAFGMFGNNQNTTTTDYLSNITSMYISSRRLAESNGDMRGGNAEFGYRHTFNTDHTLDLTASYNTWQNSSATSYSQNKLLADSTQNNSYQSQTSDIGPQTWDIQLDYSNTLNEHHKIEAGYKATLFHEDSPVETKSGTNAENATITEALYNRFIYDQNIHALYATYSGSIDNFGFQAGLRGEYTQTKTQSLGYQQGINDVAPYENDYLRLFPTLFLSYHLPNENELQLNYTKRIQRPFGGQLNSFMNITDSTNISFGNPYLEPQYANAYELNYIKTWQDVQTLSVSAYYRNSNNVIQRISYLDGNIMKTTSYNIANATSIGTEIVSKNKICRIVDLTSTVNLFYYQLDGFSYLPQGASTPVIGEGENNFSWNVRMIANIALPKTWSLQLRGDYRAKTLIAQGYREPVYRIDAGVRKTIKDFTINLNCRDVLDSFRFTSVTSGTGYEQYAQNWSHGRRLNLTVSYSFGNMKPKPQKEKKIQESGYDSIDGGEE